MPKANPNELLAEAAEDAKHAWPDSMEWSHVLAKQHDGWKSVGFKLPFLTVGFTSDSFRGAPGVQTLVNTIRDLVGSGKSLAVIRPDPLPRGAGWKTFMMALAEFATQAGYLVLTEDALRSESYPYSADSKVGWRETTFEPRALLNDQERFFEGVTGVEKKVLALNASTSNHGKQKFLMILSAEALKRQSDNGFLSKVKRLSKNGADFPILTYPQGVDWQAILNTRVLNTKVDIRALLARPEGSLPGVSASAKSDVICQRSQVEAIEVFLRNLLHLTRARSSLVLQGDYGIGKSVMLERTRLVLRVLRSGDVVTHAQWRDLGYSSPDTDLSRRIHVVDDGFGAVGSVFTVHPTVELVRNRPPFIAATNAPTENVLATLRGHAPNKAPPFMHFSISELPGKDYSDGGSQDVVRI